MTGIIYLDWMVLAVSLFNTILLIWLGLTVLLNTERQTAGLWLASGALLLGGLFFLIHTIIVGFSFQLASPILDFWWRMGWLPVVCLPFAWYTVILWYSGFWQPQISALRTRHRIWFYVNLMATMAGAGLIIFGSPLPTTEQLLHFEIYAVPAVAGIPLLFIFFPLYTLLCVVLSLDVLRRPGPSTRVMGDLARQRARPWLVATSLVLLLVSVMVGLALAYFVLSVRFRITPGYGGSGSEANIYLAQVTLGWLDLFIASLISFAILLVGQSIVAYEVFTGKTLPRRGLRRFWRQAVFLAAGLGFLLAGIIQINLPQIYTITLATVFIAIFYALLSWRSYVERERSVENLRPFISSQQLLAQILAGSENFNAPPDRQAFDALCGGLLDARLAYLTPVGEMAPLAAPALTYPPGANEPGSIGDLASRMTDTNAELCLPLPRDIPLAGQFDGQAWVVPLWSQRGLIGLLILGEKMDNSLYTQEEVELARMAGERILDARASAEIARRLVALQRQRIAESQVIDRRTRRVLHDEVLPSLHTALLYLSAKNADQAISQEGLQSLSDAHSQISNLLRDLPTPVAPEVARLGLLGAVQQMAEQEFSSDFDRVTYRADPKAGEPAHSIPTVAAEVIYYATREAIRNAARHGRGEDENYHLTLHVQVVWQEGLKIIVEDNGVGLPPHDSPKASSAAPIAVAKSSGQGLALHSTLLAVLGGTLELTKAAGQVTRLIIFLPQKSFQEWR